MEFLINGRFLTQPVTGVQRYAREILDGIDALLTNNRDTQITVISPRLTEPPPTWKNIILRQVGILQGHPWEQVELPLYARGKLLFCPGNTAPIISLIGAQDVVVTIHDLSYKYFPEAYRRAFRLWYRFLIPLALRRATSIITVSESERMAIIQHYPFAASRLHVIANGGLPLNFPESSFDTQAQSNFDAPAQNNYVLYVGSFSKRKNFPRLIEVACRLARERGFHFVFVGDTAKTMTTHEVGISEDVSPFITLIGPTDDPDKLASLYRQAACFLFPSLYKSSGLPPIEAMAYGCPVIASDIPALRERCGDAAIYCDPYDVELIVSATTRVMEDAALRLHMRTLGYRQAASFSWTRSAQQTLELICGLRLPESHSTVAS